MHNSACAPCPACVPVSDHHPSILVPQVEEFSYLRGNMVDGLELHVVAFTVVDTDDYAGLVDLNACVSNFRDCGALVSRSYRPKRYGVRVHSDLL